MDYLAQQIFIEGYCDALAFLEGSSTAKYLNHHSLGGTFFGPPLFRWFNSELKKGDSFMGVKRLYPKYVRYCAKRDYKPLPEKEFIKEGKKYYELKAKVDLGQFGVSTGGALVSGIGSTIGNAAALNAMTTGVTSIGGMVGGATLGALGSMATMGSTIGSEVYRRRRGFIDKAHMRHDIDDY